MFTIAMTSAHRSLRPVSRLGIAMLRSVALCASLLASAQAPAAEPLSASDRQAIEQTIRRQLEAFENDDAESAFAFATPDIQKMFGTSDAFMEMVRENYEPVYRAGSVLFIGLQQVSRQWVQTVRLVDGEGRVWRALFTMKRQADKSWKVGGCQLVQTPAIAT